MNTTEQLSLYKRCSIVLALVAITAVVAAMESQDREVNAKLEAEALARKAIRPDQLCISQFGPGEWRAVPSSSLRCSPPARTVPNHILSIPVAEAK
jgi:hypothetical protein